MEISEEEKDQIAAAYDNNVSIRKLAVQYGISVKACREVLREKRVVVLLSNGKGSRKYTSNGDFFNVICREEQTYWLGFLSADGHITGNSIITVLQYGDEKHLRKFAAAVETTAQVKCQWSATRGTLRKYARLEVTSEAMVYALRILGVKPRKTKDIIPCTNILGRMERELEIAYWRGWVDGDGWVSYYPRDGSYKGICALGFVGNEAVATGFRDFVGESVAHTKVYIHPWSGMYQVTYSGKAAKKVARLLYENATVYLDRKMEKAKK